MKATRKIIAIAAIVVLLAGLMSSCRASRCGGCPTFSLEQVD